MKRCILLLSIVFVFSSSSGGGGRSPIKVEGLDPYTLSSQIENSLDEHERQKKMRNSQSTNMASEMHNKSKWKKYEEISTKIQKRLKSIDFVLQAMPTGIVISRKAKDIKETQQKILQEIQSAPKALKEVLPKQIKFVDDLQMLIRYMLGIIASYGAINQMERGDRQILLNYALEEVDRLNYDSFATLMVIRFAKEEEQRRKALLDFYIQRDKDLVEDFLKNIKQL